MIVLSADLRFWQEMKSQVQAESLRKLVHNLRRKHPGRTNRCFNPAGLLSAPVVLVTTGTVMAIGVWLPFSPLASAIKLQPLPSSYFIYLPLVLLAYCLLTQVMKIFYVRRFKSWL